VLSKRRKSYPTQMARDFGALVGAHVDDAGVVLESSGGLLFLGMMIIMPLSIISMVIFALANGIPS
jgi:transcriptional regulator with AAA-type ATPase domain